MAALAGDATDTSGLEQAILGSGAALVPSYNQPPGPRSTHTTALQAHLGSARYCSLSLRLLPLSSGTTFQARSSYARCASSSRVKLTNPLQAAAGRRRGVAAHRSTGAPRPCSPASAAVQQCGCPPPAPTHHWSAYWVPVAALFRPLSNTSPYLHSAAWHARAVSIMPSRRRQPRIAAGRQKHRPPGQPAPTASAPHTCQRPPAAAPAWPLHSRAPQTALW